MGLHIILCRLKQQAAAKRPWQWWQGSASSSECSAHCTQTRFHNRRIHLAGRKKPYLGIVVLQEATRFARRPSFPFLTDRAILYYAP